VSGPTTRRRDMRFHLGTAVTVTKASNGSVDTSRNVLPQLAGTQVTVSEGHPFATQKGRGGDVGGDFFTQKSYVASPKTNIGISRRVMIFPPSVYRDIKYDGPVYPMNPTAAQYGFPPHTSSNNSQLDAWGAKAVARCKPTNSVADASVFVGELFKEGLPKLIGIQTWKERTRKAKDKTAANEYLNVQFGWLPLLHDVRSIGHAVVKADTVLSQYERDSGGTVRRKYHFPTVKTRTETVMATNAQPYGPNSTDCFLPPYGDLIRVRETTQERWFSGAFTYHLQTGNDYRSSMIRGAQQAKKLFGITITPTVLWNLAPWSWATDWFLNTGDVISNLTDWATDGLVMRYGYMMEHTIVKDTYTLTKSGLYSGQSVPPLVMVTETKIRRRANPFGFGLTWGGLSPRQQSIAVALGLTRRK